jgi:hypothetical protein
MLKQVTIATNPFDSETWVKHEVENVPELLMCEFAEWPDSARIYHGNVSEANDVTPHNDAEVERLAAMPGPFYVVVYPEGMDPLTIGIILVVAIIAATVLAPEVEIPNSTVRNRQQSSANNELAERSNRARVMARIPDIVGTVRSTPDLIEVPYSLFIDNVEVEYAYMCIGRGEYTVNDIRDDTTPVSTIVGSSVAVFGPNTSPNYGSPQLLIGAAINEPVLNVRRSSAVNGQVVSAPNGQSVTGNKDIQFIAPNIIQLVSGSALDFSDKFEAGSILRISDAAKYGAYVTESRYIRASNQGYVAIVSNNANAAYSVGGEISITGSYFEDPNAYRPAASGYSVDGVYTIQSVQKYPYTENGTQLYDYILYLVSPEKIRSDWAEAQDDFTSLSSVTIKTSSGVPVYDLAGEYLISSVESKRIYLNNPAAVRPAWANIGTTEFISPDLTTAGDKWIGPFVLDANDRTDVYANFVALNGLYKDDGTNQIRVNVTIELEVTPINLDGTVRGAVQTWQQVIEGSSTFTTTRASSFKINTAVSGRCSVRARRITSSDVGFNGTVVDEIKWRDLYSVSRVSNQHFGDVTTVQSVTLATDGALTLKARKLNMLASRRIQVLQGNGSYVLGTSSRASDIIRHVCLDKYIGNRPLAELDLTGIYTTIDQVAAYFGTSVAAEFNYTFDSENLSFEETVSSIAAAVHCTAYRRGNVIKLSFEKLTPDSTILFNHRNKLPGTETRTVNFGNSNDNDGVEYQYIDPIDDAAVTIYLPANRSAINPKKVESIGVRSRLQAYFQAWRLWNKIRYSNQTVEFEATQESELVIPQDRILVADNTRSNSQDGEVLEQNGLELILSHAVTVGAGYSIFLQHTDGSVESIGVTAGAAANRVILARAPRAALALDYDLFARTTYVIVGNNSSRQSAYLVAEKEPQSAYISRIKAINYDDRYYTNDKDFINGAVNAAGN